jgi:hypothetical protein
MSSHFEMMFLKNRYKVGIKASPAQAVASENILEFALRGVIFNELIAKLRGLSFLEIKKRGWGYVCWGREVMRCVC